MATNEVAGRLMDLYCFYKERYAYMYRAKDGTIGYKTPQDRQLTIKQIYNHVDGKQTISVFADGVDTVFSTFDIDEPGLDKVRLVVDRLAELGVPRDKMYISSSGNKGHHVDIFYDKPVYKSSGERLFKYVMEDPAVAAIRLEYFPTHHKCIKIPLGINYKTGRRCWYLDQETLAEVEDKRYVVGIQKWSADEFNELMHKLNKKAFMERLEEANKNAGERAEKSDVWRDRVVSPKRAEQEPVLTGPGQRHEKMLNKAIYERVHGAGEEDLEVELRAWLARQNPEYIDSSESEVEKDMGYIIKSVVQRYETSEQWKKRVNREWSSAGAITAVDVSNILLCVETPAARKVAFLICAYTRCFGDCVMGYDQITKLTGFSSRTVSEAVKSMIKSKVIKTFTRGGLKEVNGAAVYFANKYKFTDNELFTAWPGILKKRKEFVLDDVKNDIANFYYRTMWAMVNHDDLKKYMKPKEYEECERVSNDRRCSAGD